MIPWSVALQAPPSMGFPRQEYWSGLSLPSPGDPPKPGIKPGSPALQAGSLPSEPPGKLLYLLVIGKTTLCICYSKLRMLNKQVINGMPIIKKERKKRGKSKNNEF